MSGIWCNYSIFSRKFMKSKSVAFLLALFLGGLGAHKFYMEKPGMGVLYLLFCWTFIPTILAFIEAIILLFTSNDTWKRKWSENYKVQTYIAK